MGKELCGRGYVPCVSTYEKAPVVRFHPLSVRVGVVGSEDSQACFQTPFALHRGDKRGAERMGRTCFHLMRQSDCKPGHRRVCKKERRNDYGKGNRVLHTEHLPKKGNLDPLRTTRESNRVLSTDKEVGLTRELLCTLRSTKKSRSSLALPAQPRDSCWFEVIFGSHSMAMRRDILRETRIKRLQAPFPKEDEGVHHSVPRFVTTFSEDIGDGI